MKPPSPQLDSVHPACRSFVAVVEELLERRQREAADESPALIWQTPDWGPRTWTRTELEDIVYSSYKQMRQGRITRPPRRETVMELADYLNCNLEERNSLLIAADTTPVTPYLTGDKLDEVLRVAVGVAQNLNLPAIIINRDWHIHYLNEQAFKLYGVTPDQLTTLPSEYQNILHLLFDPNLPLYPRLIQNRDSWTRMARQTVYGFKAANRLCQLEPWYQTLVAQLMRLPEFENHWRTVQIDSDFQTDPSAQAQSPAVLVDTALPQAQPEPTRVWVRPLLISVGYFQFDFPQIVAFLPADPASRAVFSRIGLLAP